MEKLAKVREIFIYPIKSCAGISVDKAIVTKHGLASVENPNIVDRKWMVVEESGNFLTQRKQPKMALIKPHVNGMYLVLSAVGMPDLKVTTETSKIIRNCRVWGANIDGYAYGNEISQWLSKFLEIENLDLVMFGADLVPRQTAQSGDVLKLSKDTDEIMYSDFSAFMIISEASLKDINSRLKVPVTIKNFRPNIFVQDCEAYNEDNWSCFKISESTFRKVKHCTRCLLTTVDPEKGVKNPEQEPLQTLKSYRTNKELYGVSPMFGINVAAETIGNTKQIAIGDSIYADEN